MRTALFSFVFLIPGFLFAQLTSTSYTAKKVGAASSGSLQTSASYKNSAFVPWYDDPVLTSSNYSGGSDAPIGPTFPVDYISFTGEYLGGSKVRLDWITANEVNNDRFEVERSNGNGWFDYIGTELSKGSGEGILAYDFLDPAAQTGENFYRLKQFDINGNYSYSNSVRIFILDEENLIGIGATSNGFKVETDFGIAQRVTVRITDLNGRILMQDGFQSEYGRAFKEFEFQATTGVYVITAEANNGHRAVEKLLLQRDQ